jgi:hypothetical protein
MPNSRIQDDPLLKETRLPTPAWITKAPRPGALPATHAAAPLDHESVDWWITGWAPLTR